MILRMGLDFVLTVTAAGVGQDVFHAETFRHFDGISVQLMNLGALHRVGMDNIGPYMQRVELDVVDLAQCFDLTNVALVPDRPGIGIDLNEEAFANYPTMPYNRPPLINPDGSLRDY
jgi:hypothetical protein